MTISYSKTTNGFYDSRIHSDLPADAVVITEDAYNALLSDQAAGKVIQGDTNGKPEAIVAPGPTSDQIRMALVASAQAALDKSDITVVRCYASGVETPAAWVKYRSALRAIISGSNATGKTLPTLPSYPSGT